MLPHFPTTQSIVCIKKIPLCNLEGVFSKSYKISQLIHTYSIAN